MIDILLCDWGGAVWLAEDHDVCEQPADAQVRFNDPLGVLKIPTAAGMVVALCERHLHLVKQHTNPPA